MRYNKGFTLVELTLAMSFISVLLLAIAILTIQISSIYNKGITLRDVNQVGQLITSDMQRTLNTASDSRVSSVLPTGDTATGGRLCVGTTVYAWNYGRELGTNHDLLNVFADGHNGDIRLVKFQSNGTDYCAKKASGGYEPVPNDAPELLANGGRDLAVQAFSIDEPTVLAGGQTMYSVHLTLGTNTTEVIEGSGCQAPKSIVDDEYCAVNQFNFVARAGNASQ